MWQSFWASYANEKLLRSTFTTKTTARGNTCFATCQSNSNKPPPAMPPDPFDSHRAKAYTPGFLLPLKAPPCGAAGCEGGTAAPKPMKCSGLLEKRSRLETRMRRICVMMSWAYD